MRVGRPRVGPLAAPQERAPPRAGGRPEAEGAVDVDPGARPPGGVADRVERVDGAGVHVAGLGADDGGAGPGREHVLERVGEHRPPLVGGDRLDARRAEPQEAERPVDRHVPLLGDDHADRRRSHEALALHVPAGVGEHPVAGGRQRGHVRHLAARDEGERRVARQPEEVDHPGAGDLLDRRDRRRRAGEAGVLVPRRHHPVGGERDRQRPADHEAEEARRAHRGDAGLGVRRPARRAPGGGPSARPAARRAGRRAPRTRRGSRRRAARGGTPGRPRRARPRRRGARAYQAVPGRRP